MTERFATLAPQQMTPRHIEVAEAIAGGRRGGLRGPFKAMLHSPELADRAQRLGEYIRFDSSLPRRLNELAILLVARHWSAQYEWWAHRQLAEEAGLDPAIADAIARRERPAAMDEQAAAVHDFAHALLTTAAVPDDAFAAVTRHFGPAGVIDLVGTLGYYGLVSMVLNVDRVALPAGAVALPA